MTGGRHADRAVARCARRRYLHRRDGSIYVHAVRRDGERVATLERSPTNNRAPWSSCAARASPWLAWHCSDGFACKGHCRPSKSSS